MSKLIIEYKGTDYEVKPLSIERWNRLNIYKEINETDIDFMLSLISVMTDLDIDEIREAPRSEIEKVVAYINEEVLNQDSRFHKSFVFNDVEYGFIDMANLTFGEFIDIDTFLQRSEVERKGNMHFLMALLYRPLVDGKLEKYDSTKVNPRAELFRQLPVKYLNGAVVFFWTLESILRANTRSSFKKVKWSKIKKTLTKALPSFGVGIKRWLASLVRTFSKSNKQHNYHSHTL
jgi:hypothetical protein